MRRNCFNKTCRFPGKRLTKSGLGCGQVWIARDGFSCRMCFSAFWAFPPTRTTARTRGRRASKSASDSIPDEMSAELAGRILLPDPMYQGTAFQMTIRLRAIPASLASLKKFFAVSSGLLSEIKSEFRALGPGASSKNNTSASIPPSQGSK